MSTRYAALPLIVTVSMLPKMPGGIEGIYRDPFAAPAASKVKPKSKNRAKARKATKTHRKKTRRR